MLHVLDANDDSKPISANIYSIIFLLFIISLIAFSYIGYNIYDLAKNTRLEEDEKFHEDHICPAIESNKALFTWEKIPGDDEEKLKDIIINNYASYDAIIDKVVKSEDNQTIYIYAKENNNSTIYSIILKNESNATLKFFGYDIDTFIAKKENGELNIYINDIRNQLNVRIGVYLDHIKDFNLKDSKWTSDFYVWLAWSSSADSNLKDNNTSIDKEDPLLGFSLINTYVDEYNINLIDPLLTYEDRYRNISDYYYYRYEIKNAEITDKFDTRLYPMDNQILTIKIEPKFSAWIKLVADCQNFYLNSSMSNRVNLIGYNITNCTGYVSTDIYDTNFGDPEKIVSNKIEVPQYNFIFRAERSDKEILFLKIFLGLICAVAVSLAALCINADNDGPRFGLEIGSLFAAVANNYIASSALPVAGVVTIIGLVHGAGIGLISLTIAQSILSTYICKDLKAISFSKRFDKYSFCILLAMFLIILFLLYYYC